MNIQEYLSRINYNGSLDPTLGTLRALQKIHLLHIPFENFDIHSDHEITLDISKIYDKIIRKNRGGFCYELNGIFNWLLCELGFETKLISGRVFDNIKGYGPEFDHLVILVNIGEDRYLTDVGFGEFVFYPIKFKLDSTHIDPRGNFVLEKHEADYFRVHKIEGDQKIVQYIFKDKERQLSDFTEMCNFHQHSPDSHFSKKKFISKATENGRVTISDYKLKITTDNEIKESDLDESSYHEYLKLHFQYKI